MEPIRGDLYRSMTRYAFDFKNGFVENPKGKPDHYFVKIDLIGKFASDILPKIKAPFTLLTGDGDLAVATFRDGVLEVLKSPLLVRWYGLNVGFNHPKLFSIPIGMGHSYCDPGGVKVFVDEINKPHEKSIPVYTSYALGSNPKARGECLKETGIMFPKAHYSNYLAEIGKSYFVISPPGSGWDCYRHWEALYLRAIPIVLDCFNFSFYRHLPFFFLEKWSDFKKFRFDQELYEKTWAGFDIGRLDFERFYEETTKREHPFFNAVF